MYSFIILSLLALFSCTEEVTDPDPLSFLALGDSYTIGESVTIDQRWPVQLYQRLIDENINMSEPQIIATTGWTTDELQNAMDEADLESDYDLVSLLIGVNNQYHRYPIDQFKTEFETLLEEAILYAGHRKDRVIVLSIPDYGVTPFGKTRDPEKIAKELDEYNEIKKLICEQAGVSFFNITNHSRNALTDQSLVAQDLLHPSGSMYSHWVDTVYPTVLSMFKN